MITITMPVLKPCPFVGELDAGELAITFPGDAPELHNLAAQVQKLCAEPVTHEDFTRGVLDMLGGEGLVVTRWHTGPWSVEVREGDDQVVREPDQIGAAGHA
jgi:hypothetical protein